MHKHIGTTVFKLLYVHIIIIIMIIMVFCVNADWKIVLLKMLAASTDPRNLNFNISLI